MSRRPLLLVASLAIAFAFPCAYSQDPGQQAPAAIEPAPAPTGPPYPTHVPPIPTRSGKVADKSDKEPSLDKKDNKKPVSPETAKNAVIWESPGDISKKNMTDGPGSASHRPQPPFTFVEEDKDGTNPKFDANDANGEKWRVKVGPEARPEVVASRILWSVGYFANEDYFVPESRIPAIHMSRTSSSIHSDGRVLNARFSRKPSKQKKIGIWEWKNNPFTGTREFNGLRVMMAVINGWDLKDENNAVYADEKTGRQIYLASDIGASFGTTGLALNHGHDRGNPKSFENSKFITRVNNDTVDFATPNAPNGVLIASFGATAGSYSKRVGMEWIGRDVPIADAKWAASLLAQLSHQQLEDAFHAGGYNDAESDTYVQIVESRITELKALP